MNDGKPGLRIESAASIILRDTITQHMHVFGEVVRRDRAAGQSVVAAYIDGLAGAFALTVAGRHADLESVEAVIIKLRDAIDRDLRHLGR